MVSTLCIQRLTAWKIKAKLEGAYAIGCHKWRKARVTNSWTTSHNIWNQKTLKLPSPSWWLTDLHVCFGRVSYHVTQLLSWFLWQAPWTLCHWNLSSACQELLPDFFFSPTSPLSTQTRAAQATERQSCVASSACEEWAAIVRLAFIKILDLELWDVAV